MYRTIAELAGAPLAAPTFPPPRFGSRPQPRPPPRPPAARTGPATRVLLLSGTPMMGEPITIYPQLRLLRPATFTSEAMFGGRYCATTGVGHKGERYYKGEVREGTAELRAFLHAALMVRRTKKSAGVGLDLPPKRRQVRRADRARACAAQAPGHEPRDRCLPRARSADGTRLDLGEMARGSRRGRG